MQLNDYYSNKYIINLHVLFSFFFHANITTSYAPTFFREKLVYINLKKVIKMIWFNFLSE